MCLHLALHNIFNMPMSRYSVFVLKVPLDTNRGLFARMMDFAGFVRRVAKIMTDLSQFCDDID